jgi:hypothetical protein
MKGFLTFIAVFFAVVSLDLLDQNKSAGSLFFAAVSTVIVLTLLSKSKIKKFKK